MSRAPRPDDRSDPQPLDYQSPARRPEEERDPAALLAMAALDRGRFQRRYARWRRWRIILYLIMLAACGVGMVFAMRWILWYKDLLEKQINP